MIIAGSLSSRLLCTAINRDWIMRIRIQRYSFRFAEQVLNGRLAIKQEIEDILFDERILLDNLSRPNFNKLLEGLFVDRVRLTQRKGYS